MTASQAPHAAEILVVDDDPDIRESLREVLEDEGYAVACVGNGREALDYLHREPRPRVILLDLMMPVMDGWQFRREQQRDPSLAPIPVVVVSGTRDAARSAAALGPATCLEKPVGFDELVEAVRQNC